MTDSVDACARVGFCRNSARKLLKKHGVVGSRIPVEELVAAEGFRVLARDWPPTTSGILLRKERVIGINSNHSLVRRRFTLAHEIGHHCLRAYSKTIC